LTTETVALALGFHRARVAPADGQVITPGVTLG